MSSVSTESAVIAEADVLDAFAVELEHDTRIDLAGIRVHAKRPAKPLEGKYLTEAVNAVKLKVEAQLHAQYPNANTSDLQAAIDAVIIRGDGLLDQRVLLGELVRNGIPDATFLESPTLGDRLFYSECSFIISGHKKSGKSWAMLATALDCVRAKRPAVYVDFENGERLFAKRLRLLGADADEIDARLHYVPFPKHLTLEGLRAELEDIAARLPGAFVVIDSLRAAIARLSPPGDPLKVNDQTSIERVCGPIMEVVKRDGITVGIIDHSTKIGTDQDEYSTSGAAAKEQAVDAVYFWTKVEPYSKRVAGVVKIRATSDRDGELDFDRYYRVGGQDDEPFCFRSTDRCALLNERLVDDLRQFAADNEKQPLTKTQIRGAVKGDNNAIDSAINWLVQNDADFYAMGGEKRGTVRYEWNSEREPVADLLDGGA
jgi:KaiC/GvpD/RAD55 family RecA-like ATPase